MTFLNLLYRVTSFIFTVTLFIIIALVFYFTGTIKTTQTVVLPKGSITKVMQSLEEQGYLLSPLDTYMVAYLLDSPKSGTLFIGGEKMSRIQFLQKLSSAKEAIDVVTLIPGETKVIFLKNLAKKYDLEEEKLNHYYETLSPYKEAGVAPETYHLPKDIKEEKVMQILISQSERKYKKLAQKYDKEYTQKSWNQILTIASIIQKEAANNDEMPIVASVIYNRLKADMALQMDGTLNYGKYSHVKVTPKRIREDKSRFNTYLNSGLPPYPICSVSTSAIVAALEPKETNFLYFMRNKKTGKHDFTHSYKEHLRNIKRAK